MINNFKVNLDLLKFYEGSQLNLKRIRLMII